MTIGRQISAIVNATAAALEALAWLLVWAVFGTWVKFDTPDGPPGHGPW